MFQSLVDTDGNLRRESVSATEYRCADDRRESGVDQDLAAHYDETPVELWIVAVSAAGMMYAINLASSHLLLLPLPTHLLPDNREHPPPRESVRPQPY